MTASQVRVSAPGVSRGTHPVCHPRPARARAAPEQRAVFFGQTMGLRITHNPDEASIDVEARPACD